MSVKLSNLIGEKNQYLRLEKVSEKYIHISIYQAKYLFKISLNYFKIMNTFKSYLFKNNKLKWSNENFEPLPRLTTINPHKSKKKLTKMVL